MAIKLLNDEVINKIAAGEVIERPASIVKELIENSIDANASKIKISIVNGGKDYIEIEDDGIGLDKDSIPLAFLRHATSKITNENDLYNIFTMGFRGEALPSIAAVSKVTLYSNKSSNVGVKAQIEGGVIKELEDYPGPQGTRIIVYDLFYNTPARKNFLKTAVTEGNNILELVNKYALAYPEISFTFIKDNRQYYKTPGNSNWLDTVKVVLGHDLAGSLISVDYQGEKYFVQGFISNPDYTRRNRKNQYFFINSRPIRSSLLYKAIDTSYKGLLVSKEHPIVILSIKLNPEEVDVNVHPQKSEVRFKDEQSIFHVVYQVLREKLTNVDYNPVHKWTKDINATVNDVITNKSNEALIFKQQDEVQEGALIFESLPRPNYINKESSLIKSPYLSKHELVHNLVDNNLAYKIIGQYNSTYILIECEDALWLIDQHAAEEKIIYTKLKKQYLNNNPASQVLAFPLTLDLSNKDIELIMDNIDLFNQLGFNIELLGYDSIIIRSAPVMSLGEERSLLLDIIDLLKSGETINIYDEALITMACKQAIKAGDRLSFHEMETIVIDLFKTEDYKNCPHGRPTLIKLNKYDIERMFKR